MTSIVYPISKPLKSNFSFFNLKESQYDILWNGLDNNQILSKVVIIASHSETIEKTTATSYLRLFDYFSQKELCCIEWRDAFDHSTMFETTKMHFQPKHESLFLVQLYTDKEAFDKNITGIVHSIQIEIKETK